MPARALAAEDIADWLTPSHAVEILDAVYGEGYLSKRTLLGRLIGSKVEAVSEETVIKARSEKRYAFHTIDPEDWLRIDTSDNFWITGDLIFSRGSSYNSTDENISHYAVKFEPNSVRDIIKDAGPKPTPTTPTKSGVAVTPDTSPKNKGGAPRKEWWDDFWIAICGRIYEGDLKPSSQADLERAMLDWASANDHDMSESSAKTAARKLFKAWKLGDKN
jgi:hypothetical protein